MPLYYNPETKQLEFERTTALYELALVSALGPWIGIYHLLKPFFLPGSLNGTDAENIATIIQAGRKNGVDEMEIEMDREVVQGLDVGALQDLTGVNITLGQKGKSRYQIKVKYKN